MTTEYNRQLNIAKQIMREDAIMLNKLAKSKVMYCDVCGECCTDETYGTESATLSAQWGYMSKKDGDTYHVDLCESCFDATISFLKQRKKELHSE
jgi:hypothetical protein